eukprot:TRINITY_DN3511_c0_g1_i1.p1 TRINITY_DN3511_c0_g1~~TRINITY_DN3511_c0_g1_i1.p1  ORF type:complete len:372 (-),score=39.20 TRINITY_DN3511_c0_g1_i1:234-1349(-)
MQEVDLDDEVLSKYYFEPIAFSPLVKRNAFKPCVNYDVVTKRTKSLDRASRQEEVKTGKKSIQLPVDSEAVQPSFSSMAIAPQSSSAPALFPSITPDSLDEQLLLASLIPEQELWQPSSPESSQSMSSLSTHRSGSTSNFSSSRSQQQLPLLVTSPASPRPSAGQQSSWAGFQPSLPVPIPSEGATGYLSPNPGNQGSTEFKTPSVESFEEFQFTPPDYSEIQETPRCAAPDPLTMLFGDIAGKKAKGNPIDAPNPKVLTSKLSMIGLKKPKKQLSCYKLDGKGGEGVGNDCVPISPGFQKVRESKLKPRSLTFTSNSVFRPFALNKSEAIRSSSVTAFHRAPHKEPRTPAPDRTFPLSNIKEGENLSEDK